VGRGWSVPPAMIAPELVDVINEMSARLGYVALDGDWGTIEPTEIPASMIPAPLRQRINHLVTTNDRMIPPSAQRAMSERALDLPALIP
jgi:hypothetical protein